MFRGSSAKESSLHPKTGICDAMPLGRRRQVSILLYNPKFRGSILWLFMRRVEGISQAISFIYRRREVIVMTRNGTDRLHLVNFQLKAGFNQCSYNSGPNKSSSSVYDGKSWSFGLNKVDWGNILQPMKVICQ